MRGQMRRALCLLFFPVAALAQSSDDITFQRTFLLRNASGTAANPGPVPHHPHLFGSGVWSAYVEGAAFLTSVSETGPAVQQHDTFSTNWLAAAAQRSVGSRGLVLFRVRGSLEPVTIRSGGYPQLFQRISPDAGGPLVDAMRPQDLIGEAALHLAYRTTSTSFAHLYLAPVGDPAVGALPYAVRASSEEFAEGPFAYDVQERVHSATRVVTGGFATSVIGIEGGVFHHSITTGRHDSIDDGNADSWGARVTVNPTRNVSLQASHGSLGDAKTRVNSASLSYGAEAGALSAIWTEIGASRTMTLEGVLRVSRSSLMVRAENLKVEDRTHVTFGYILDLAYRGGYRAGVGVNVDYHTKTRALTPVYGHKPQSIYLFARVRTEARRR
jgi:hypothetical protein